MSSKEEKKTISSENVKASSSAKNKIAWLSNGLGEEAGDFAGDSSLDDDTYYQFETEEAESSKSDND